MKKTHVLLALLSSSPLPSMALAASSDWALSGETRMRLVVAEPMTGDKSVRAALEVQLAPHWKTYWQDPGEAGVPLTLDLTGSQNITLTKVHYPAPMRFDDGVTVWAGYDAPVVFPLELVRADAGASRLNANIFIGICEKICVPFQTSLSVNIDDASASNADQMFVDRAFSALPKQADDANGVTSAILNGEDLTITAKLKTGVTAPELFLASPRGWQFSAPKLISQEDTLATFEAQALFAPKVKPTEPVNFDYTLVLSNEAVSGSASLAN